jgi:HPt (histidine-containing phosphotransfer) domain-containing protein
VLKQLCQQLEKSLHQESDIAALEPELLELSDEMANVFLFIAPHGSLSRRERVRVRAQPTTHNPQPTTLTIHKLHGSASYSGVPRLKQLCQQLEKSLHQESDIAADGARIWISRCSSSSHRTVPSPAGRGLG